MRQKAEREIREAVASLGYSEWYRIDQVRIRTNLIRKVFDKTILDMERVGTIRLSTGNAEEMRYVDVGNLIQYGETIYFKFSFLDVEPPQANEPSAPEPISDPSPTSVKVINITLRGFSRLEWKKFEYLCEQREGKTAVQKLSEMIYKYNNEDS